MKYLVICIATIALISCSSAQKKNQAEESPEVKRDVKTELLWESDSTLRTPESVLVEEGRNVIYVSNMNLDWPENSGHGFISRLGMDGNIMDLKWVTGLNGPKGMGLFGDNLYVADNDELVDIDINSGKILNKVKIEGNPGLNDVTVDDEGNVYVSGYNSNTIYKVKDGNVETFFKGKEGENFNGLLWEKNQMLLITSGGGTFKSINLATKDTTILARNMGHGDGIAAIGDGDYLTSDWQGEVFYIPPKGEPIRLIDTRDLDIYAADIDYSSVNNVVYVPTFYDNRVKAYKLITNLTPNDSE